MRQSPGTLTARALRLGVLGFGRGGAASSRLSLRRLPEAEQSLAFEILAIALVPAPRLIPTAAAFAQTEPRPRSSRPGLPLRMRGAHGRSLTPKG